MDAASIADAVYVCTGVHRDDAGRPISFGYGLWVEGGLRRLGSVRNGVDPRDLAAAARRPFRYFGHVMLITGQSIEASGAMRHPTFAGWRTDECACECRA